MEHNESLCSFNYDGQKCFKKSECQICRQCGDGGHGGHCPGHLGVDEHFTKKPGAPAAKPTKKSKSED